MGQCFTSLPLVKLFLLFIYIPVVRIMDYILVQFGDFLPFIYP